MCCDAARGHIVVRTSGNRIAFIVLAALFVPATAQAGFFDQLLGGSQSGSFFGFGVPSYGSEDRPIGHHSIHPRKIVEDKPARQTPTDLMHDPTLRFGDAVVTKTGVNIYIRERGARIHHADDFAPLKTVRSINPREKLALAEINPARTSEMVAENRHVVTGRSSAYISKGVMIKDHDGKTIRYVGP
jgi:hypothetical protein